jgi:MFS family permease
MTIKSLNKNITASAPVSVSRRSFAALANPQFRNYFAYATAAMVADNIEHVISYWVMYQKFHSPALGGFAVISHWVPFLFFAGFTGLLADRFDIRRLIQIGMVLYMGVSLCWGAMFLTDSVTIPRAMTLLVVHGMAGVIWSPAAQVLIHQIVMPTELSSAVRIAATGRYLGTLVGPALGSALLLFFGSSYGILINALIYAPLFMWLFRAPARQAAPGTRATTLRGMSEVWSAIKVVARHPLLYSMTFLIGAASFFVGNAYQAQMPGFASDLGHGRADFSYGALLAADAAGGLIGGIVLESWGLLPPSIRAAFVLAISWCIALITFALSSSYLLSVAVLCFAGFVELAFNSMAQALVQINAPAEIRGRVIGVFTMAGMGLRTFSGFSVGLLGARFGIHISLASSAAVLLVVYLLVVSLNSIPQARQQS